MAEPLHVWTDTITISYFLNLKCHQHKQIQTQKIQKVTKSTKSIHPS
jgi:hypothetical protein